MDISYESNALDAYLQQVNKKSKLLTKEEEYDIAVAVANGDLRAKNRMIEANLRLVISVAKRYQYSVIPLVDIIQEGNTGLIRAVEKFDPNKGFRFSTYAVWWIKNNIERSIMNSDRTIRIPIHVGKMHKSIAKVAKELGLDVGSDNDLVVIAKVLETDVDEVMDVLSYYFSELSLDKGIVTDNESVTTLVDIIEDQSIRTPSAEIEGGSTRDYLLALLENLPAYERQVVELRFGLTGEEPLSLSRIGERLSMSREKVRIVIRTTLRRLKPKLLINDVQRHDYIS
ncbi:MAG: sigma-70 family RNA polymerase sigma factor [Moritella sp.]|uniref:sigma-70 family RNA polymerase sigma factor n=1 Tax=Moritella sp. TaxID=78556 RepID=UPI00217441BC|nr:sigma-70 family RNA polymerase sigma factor [Moritella sp.]MBL1417398.1 sigma-70 family RNA polymerase sigma factor [Moritella sp.]